MPNNNVEGYEDFIDSTVKVDLTPEEYYKLNPPSANISPTELHVNRRYRYLDDKEVFYKWLELGSSGELYRYYINSGKLSPNTGKPPDERSLLIAVFRYITTSFDDAFEQLKIAYKNANNEVTDDQLIEYLLHKIPDFTTSRYYAKFIVEHKLYEKYAYAIPKKSGIGEHQIQSMMKSNGDFNVYRFHEGKLPKAVVNKITRLGLI